MADPWLEAMLAEWERYYDALGEPAASVVAARGFNYGDILGGMACTIPLADPHRMIEGDTR